MPVMEGLEVLKVLKHNDQTAQTDPSDLAYRRGGDR